MNPILNGYGVWILPNVLVKNPLLTSQKFQNYNPTPPGGDFLITEDGDNIITEDGDFLITED